MPTLPPAYSYWFQFRPDLYLATSHDGYILSFVIFGNGIDSVKLLSFPSPVWVKHHPNIDRIPVRTEISQLQSDYSWFLFFLTDENRSLCFLIEGLQHGAEVSALPEQEPKPSGACALDGVVEAAPRNSVERTLKFEPRISSLGRCSATHRSHDKLGEIFERLWFNDFHFLLAPSIYTSSAGDIPSQLTKYRHYTH